MDYRPHIKARLGSEEWTDLLELDGAKKLAKDHPPKVLILYGSLRT